MTDDLLQKARELHAEGMAWVNIRKSLHIGSRRLARLKRAIGGTDAPPRKQTTPEKPKNAMNKPQTSLTITLTPAAYERLEWIAESAYMAPDAFVASLVAAYISDSPQTITLAPRDPDEEGEETESDGDGEAEEEAPEENGGEETESGAEDDEETDEDEDEKPQKSVFKFRKRDFAWLTPGAEFSVEYQDKLVDVKCDALMRMNPANGTKRLISELEEPGDIIRCRAADGAFEGTLEFYPEEVIHED